MVQRYATRQEITWDALARVLSELEMSPCRYLQRTGLFAEQELEFTNESEIIERILSDVAYQEQIAHAALQLQHGDHDAPRLHSYYWEASVDAVGLTYRQKYLTIDLVLEPTRAGQSRVLLPIIVVKCKRGGYKYWGVMNINEALGTIHVLLEA